MARAKKETKILSIRCDVKAFDKLEQICEQTGMPKTTAVERAIMEYAEKVQKTK